MGLDQIARSRNEEDARVIGDWRKHPNLQGWMEALWLTKRGDSFNCVEVELDAADLDALEFAVNEGTLPKTEGFFFGDSADERYKECDLEFIRKARAEIKDGNRVFYSSWW